MRRKLIFTLWSIFGIRRYHYTLDDHKDTTEQCPIKGAGVGSIWCNNMCPKRGRSNRHQQWVECHSLSRWLKKNKRFTVPEVKKGVEYVKK